MHAATEPQFVRSPDANQLTPHRHGRMVRVSVVFLGALSAVAVSELASASSAQDSSPGVTLVPNTAGDEGVHPDYPNATVMPLPSVPPVPGGHPVGEPDASTSNHGPPGFSGTGTRTPIIIIPNDR
jgi:hypothetical protein